MAEPSAASPGPPAEAASSASANPNILPDALEGTGAEVGRPKAFRIFPTTSGSVRKARTTMGTGRPGREHLGQAADGLAVDSRPPGNLPVADDATD